jgi:hypothetical protein
MTPLWVAWALAADVAPCPMPTTRTAFVLTMTPGRSLPTSFGHSALLVYDPADGLQSAVYDHGHYDSQDPWFPVDYVLGRAQYWGKKRPLQRVRDLYRHWGRDIHAQRLALLPEEIDLLVAHQERHIGRENSFAYHWYADNCTTRIRDALDEVMFEGLRPLMKRPSGTSVRALLLDHVQGAWLSHPLRWGAGADASAELSSWEAAFLPASLMRGLDAVERENGNVLVRRTCRLVGAGGALPPEEHPDPTWLYAVLGLAAGGTLGASAARPRLGRVLVVPFTLAVAVVAGLDLLVAATRAGAPWWSHHHQLIASPFVLSLTAWAAGVRIARPVARITVAVAVLFALQWTLRGFPHGNLAAVALILPGLIASLVVLERLPPPDEVP